MSNASSASEPALMRRRLRNQLRRAREAAGRTQKDVTTEMYWSVSKLIRIESGTVNISVNDLRMLLAYYQVSSDRINEMVQMARAAKDASPWAPWRGDVSPEYMAYLGYEAVSAIIRNFESTLVPGLLQTEDYAREAISKIGLTDKVDSLVDLRIFRQELLDRPSPPKLNFILDESVIRRQVGSAEIMRKQLERILALSELEHITVRIVPFEVGIYQQMRTPYVLFEFEEDEDEDVLYVESALGEMIKDDMIDKEEDPLTPQRYLNHFWEMEQIAQREAAPSLLKTAAHSFK